MTLVKQRGVAIRLFTVRESRGGAYASQTNPPTFSLPVGLAPRFPRLDLQEGASHGAYVVLQGAAGSRPEHKVNP